MACLGPLVADSDWRVSTTAAVALLEPQVRWAAGMEGSLKYFRYGEATGGRDDTPLQSYERPLLPLADTPAFLPTANSRLAAAGDEALAALALLLAQYGQFEGLDRLAARRAELESEQGFGVATVLVTGVALSRDPKYVPVLRQMAAERKDIESLREILKGLRGMEGPEARQLRLEINKRMRTAPDSPLARLLD